MRIRLPQSRDTAENPPSRGERRTTMRTRWKRALVAVIAGAALLVVAGVAYATSTAATRSRAAACA